MLSPVSGHISDHTQIIDMNIKLQLCQITDGIILQYNREIKHGLLFFFFLHIWTYIFIQNKIKHLKCDIWYNRICWPRPLRTLCIRQPLCVSELLCYWWERILLQQRFISLSVSVSIGTFKTIRMQTASLGYISTDRYNIIRLCNCTYTSLQGRIT